MEDELIRILSEFGYPVYLQGSLSPDEKFPNDFFTFWNNDSEDGSHYDNREHSTLYDYDVNFYSVSPNRVYDILRAAKHSLKEKGWIVSGDGYSLSSGVQTHDGRGIRAYYKRYIVRK